MFALHSQSVFVANPLSRSNSNSNIKMYQMYSNTVRPFVYLLFNLDRGKITGLIHLRLCCINLVRVLHYYIHPICIIKLSDKIQCCKTCNIADATKKKKTFISFSRKKRQKHAKVEVLLHYFEKTNYIVESTRSQGKSESQLADVKEKRFMFAQIGLPFSSS